MSKFKPQSINSMQKCLGLSPVDPTSSAAIDPELLFTARSGKSLRSYAISSDSSLPPREMEQMIVAGLEAETGRDWTIKKSKR